MGSPSRDPGLDRPQGEIAGSSRNPTRLAQGLAGLQAGPRDILALQRAAGNRATASLLRSSSARSGLPGAAGRRLLQRQSQETMRQQARRLAPGGALRINLNHEPIITALKRMEGEFGYWDGSGVDWDNHSVADDIRQACSGTYFNNSRLWSSGWKTGEGFWELSRWGLSFDVKVDLELFIANEHLLHESEGTFTSRGSTSESREESEATTTSGQIKGGVGGHQGAPSGEASAGVSHTRGERRTVTLQGEAGVSVVLPAEVISGDAYVLVTLKHDPTPGSISTKRRWVRAGSITAADVVGAH
jgi:hypothetical protein